MKRLILSLMLIACVCVTSAFGQGNCVPYADDTYDLGTPSKEWKDGYFDGTVYADTLDVGSIAAGAQTIDGTLNVKTNFTVGGTSSFTGKVTATGAVDIGGALTVATTLVVTGDVTAATDIELGNASDTTLARVSGGLVSIEGKNIYVVGGTDVAVADGGTALSSGTSGGVLAFTAAGTLASSALLTDHGPVVGGGAGAAPTAIAAGTDGQSLLGQTSGDPAFTTLGGDVSTVSSAGVVVLADGAVPAAEVGAGTLPADVTGVDGNFAVATNATVGGTLDVTAAANFGAAVTVATTLVVTNGITGGGALDLTGGGPIGITQLNVTSTNTYEIAGTRSYYVLDASGQSDTAVTNTIAAPAKAGLILYLVNDGTTNDVEITEGTTLDAGGALVLTPEDAAILISRSAAAWSVASINVN